MTPTKRLFDLGLAIILAVPLVPIILIVALIVRIRDGSPVLYLSERMGSPDRGFTLVKFRTMQADPQDRGVSGGDKADRITDLGRALRKTHLDELPQLWNILRGDMSFVGPRPPLRRYVDLRPDLYAQVLESRPGITGLATLAFHDHEAAILAQCSTAEQTERAYIDRCVPRKAALDLIYQRNWSICLDLVLIGRTALQVLGR